jgi:hypothetical protein
MRFIPDPNLRQGNQHTPLECKLTPGHPKGTTSAEINANDYSSFFFLMLPSSFFFLMTCLAWLSVSLAWTILVALTVQFGEFFVFLFHYRYFIDPFPVVVWIPHTNEYRMRSDQTAINTTQCSNRTNQGHLYISLSVCHG